MFDLIKRWQFRTATNRPLRCSNRVVLSFEDLEIRVLLSSGVIHATAFDGPLSAVALVAEPVNLNATSAQSQQTLSDVVPGGSSSRVLPARPIRAPVQTGAPPNGATGSAGQPAVSTLAPAINTTVDGTLPGVNAPISPLPSPTSILPGQGTAGGTRAGGQLLLPGGVTMPPTPTQQILAGVINTADPYAAFERTILTKEGFKTASGREMPIPPQDDTPKNPVRAEVPTPPQHHTRQNPGRASGAFEEESELDRPDPSRPSTDDQAARHRHQTDAFFADGAPMGEDQGWAHDNAFTLAGAMLIFSGFWPGDRGRHSEDPRRARRAPGRVVD